MAKTIKSGELFDGVAVTPELAELLNNRNRAIDSINSLEGVKADRWNQGSKEYKANKKKIAENEASALASEGIISSTTGTIDKLLSNLKNLKGKNTPGVTAQTTASSALVSGTRERSVLSALV